MKKLTCLLLSLLLAAGMTACGGKNPAAGPAASAGPEKTSGAEASAAETQAAPKAAEERPVIDVVSEPLADGDPAATLAPYGASGVQDAPTPEPPSGDPAAIPSGPVSDTESPVPAADTGSLSPASDGTFTITFAGDILMDPGYAAGSALTQRGAEGSFDEEALALMRGADLFVVNNEFAYTTRGTAVSKQYNFRADPKHAAILNDMGADLVTLGNNHTYDYGEEGLLDTLDALDRVGIPYIGAGRDLAEAGSPKILTVDGFRIALLNAETILFNVNPPDQCAGENKPGTFDCYRPEMLFDAVRKAKTEADYCIVITHWGSEGKSAPNEKQLMISKGAAEAGADLIIGGHPHVLQGISHLDTVPVCYSLGNYLFHSGTYDTGVIQAVFRPGDRTLETLRFVPMQCRNMKVFTLSGSEKERLLNYMRGLSPDVQIGDDGRILLP